MKMTSLSSIVVSCLVLIGGNTAIEANMLGIDESMQAAKQAAQKGIAPKQQVAQKGIAVSQQSALQQALQEAQKEAQKEVHIIGKAIEAVQKAELYTEMAASQQAIQLGKQAAQLGLNISQAAQKAVALAVEQQGIVGEIEEALIQAIMKESRIIETISSRIEELAQEKISDPHLKDLMTKEIKLEQRIRKIASDIINLEKAL